MNAPNGRPMQQQQDSLTYLVFTMHGHVRHDVNNK